MALPGATCGMPSITCARMKSGQLDTSSVCSGAQFDTNLAKPIKEENNSRLHHFTQSSYVCSVIGAVQRVALSATVARETHSNKHEEISGGGRTDNKPADRKEQAYMMRNSIIPNY